MTTVGITGVTDPDGGAVTITAQSIRQDEPLNGTGDGDAAPDGQLSPLKLRAERSGNANGRVYRILFFGRDGAGATCAGMVTVCAPHDHNGACGDGGPLYDSTAVPTCNTGDCRKGFR
jgi:chitinase